MLLLWAVCIALAAAVIFLACKICFLRKSIREIAEDFAECLSLDTNTQITVSSGDRTIRDLAQGINRQLSDLRKIRQRYTNGDRELKEAITNVSHDLRTPLTVICGYLDLLEKQELSGDAERYVEQIRNRSEALKQLTEELFRYSVLSSMQELKFETVNLCQLLEESLLSFEGAFRQANVEPEIRIPERAISRTLDKTAAARIFGNIINNAIRYSDGDFLVCMNDDGVITFTNTSKGLSAVEASKLFDRFYTVDSARKSTGLGLSIAKMLTERMNGAIGAGYENDRFTIWVDFRPL